ncbi:extracellular solute-binding protein [Cohnella sp. GCM10020058]|uniref:extracellular solute-binding protein n=1 Tax=Cohnella sp. GCM10020058 TaxID=3317330 RepID=UPI0036413BDC
MKGRAIRFFLVLLITISWFLCGAGCKSDSGLDRSANNNGIGGTAPAQTLRIAWMESSKWGKDDIAERLEKMFGIAFDFVSLNWSDAANKLNVMVASGDVPDMFYYPALDDPSTKSVYIKWAESGILKPLPDDLGRYPNIERVMKQYDYMKIGGRHYSIPRLAWQPENQHLSVGILVRTDYMRQLGFADMPASLDEFVHLLTAMRDGDPDENGKSDTIPFSPGSVGLLFLQSLYGLTNGWIQENGRYVPSYISDKYLAYTKFVKTLYDDGLIDSDFATEVPEQVSDKFAAGQIGAVGAQLEATSMQVTLFDKLAKTVPDPYDIVDLLPITKGPYGDLVMTNQFNHYSATLFGAHMSDEKMDRALRLYDYLLSDKGLELMRWGIEDRDYRKEDGQYVDLRKAESVSGTPNSLNVEKPTTNLKLLVSWDVDGGWGNPSLARALVDLEKKHIAIYQKYIQQDKGARINYLYEPALDRFNYTDLTQLFFNNAVLGKYPDIDAAFKQMVAQVLTERGGSEAIRVANERAAAMP